MSYLVASSDQYDGYLSDVPSVASYGHSEISNDLILSTKALEKHFKDKYKVLRSAYEQRIRQLSDVVQDTCTGLFSDELLMEMKNDKTSSAFIPAHLSEIINDHLESERERYIHEIVSKLSAISLELSQGNQANKALNQKVEQMARDVQRGKESELSIPPLKEKIITIEKQYQDYLQHSESELSQLKTEISTLNTELSHLRKDLEVTNQSLVEKTRECEHYKAADHQKQREVLLLEQSFEQSSRELAIIEGMDAQEQVLKKEMQAQLSAVTAQRNALQSETSSLRSQLQYNSEELARHVELLAAHKDAEAANRDRIAELMAQVEEMLAAEANESNLAISSLHSKTRLFRDRMQTELAHEKRLVATLQDEVAHQRAVGEDYARENRKLAEENSAALESLKKEQQRNSSAAIEIKELTSQMQADKMKVHELQHTIKQLNEKLDQFEERKRHEIAMITDTVRRDALRQHESEQSTLEKHTEAYRIRYQNELNLVQSSLRNSYSVETDLATEISFKNAVSNWAREKSQLVQAHQEELYAVSSRLRAEAETGTNALKSRLQEASGYITRMKEALAENQTALTQQMTAYEQLQGKFNTQAQLLASTQLQLQQQQQMFLQHQQSFTSSVSGDRHITDKMSGTGPSQHSISGNFSNVGATAHQHGNDSIDGLRSLHSNANHTSHTGGSGSVSTPAKTNFIQSNINSVRAASHSNSVQSGHSSGLGFSKSLYDKMLQKSPRSASPSTQHSQRNVAGIAQNAVHNNRYRDVHDENNIRGVSDSTVALQREVEVLTGSLEESRSEARRLAQSLQEVENLLRTERANIVQVKTVFMSQFESLVGSYKALQQQFEAYKESQTVAAIVPISLANQSHVKGAEAPTAATDLSTDSIDASTLQSADLFDTTANHSAIANNSTAVGNALNATTIQQHQQELLQSEQSLLHQQDLHQITLSELETSREATIQARKQTAKYHAVLQAVSRTFRDQLNYLRNELAFIRNLHNNMVVQGTLQTSRHAAEASNKLISRLQSTESELMAVTRQVKIELAKSHTKEMKALEAVYIAKITSLEAQHAAELQEQHDSIMNKAQSVVSAFGDDAALALRSGGGVNTSKPSSTYINSGAAYTATAAHESVLTGVTEALQSSGLLSSATSGEILAMAAAHQEPSFAARSAAKTLLASAVDLFTLSAQKKVVGISNEVEASGVKNNDLSLSTYVGADNHKDLSSSQRRFSADPSRPSSGAENEFDTSYQVSQRFFAEFSEHASSFAATATDSFE